MHQLNILLFKGNEHRLRRRLYEEIRPLFPSRVLIKNIIEAELGRQFDVLKYENELHAGDFCDGCKEPRCCTATDVVYLGESDIIRLRAKGHRDFARPVKDEKGNEWASIRYCAPCQFLHDNRCTIYDYRPHVCWRYPMQVDGETGKAIFYISSECCIAYNLMKRQIIDAIKKTDVLI